VSGNALKIGTVSVGIICKTPRPGFSKTRLSPPLTPDECAEISACFIQDLAATIEVVSIDHGIAGYAVYTPFGSEAELGRLLPSGFGLALQGDGDLGQRLNQGINDLLAMGHAGAILVNSDSPTLPRRILEEAVMAVRTSDQVVLSPAIDGGYTFIGLSRPHPQLFSGIPWSTDAVLQLTLERAKEIGLPATVLDPWYDVDDAASYAMLQAELSGTPPAFAAPGYPSEDAPRTRHFLERRAGGLKSGGI
jgi:hypothetical protein